VPQFLPIVFEMALHKLKRQAFTEVLHDCLYGGKGQIENSEKSVAGRVKNSLEIIAGVIRQEHRAGDKGRIVRIVTFNVDDLLERKAMGATSRARS
jgi:hypothetical protein